MARRDGQPFSKRLLLLGGTIQSPPMGEMARLATGFHLREIQNGESLSMPLSRPMPEIGPHCHELRIEDLQLNTTWRIIYCIEDTDVLVLEVFQKKTRQTPENVKRVSRERRSRYLEAKEGK